MKPTATFGIILYMPFSRSSLLLFLIFKKKKKKLFWLHLVPSMPHKHIMRPWLQQFVFESVFHRSSSFVSQTFPTSSFSDFGTAPMLGPTLHTVYHVSRKICRIFLELKIRFWFLCGDHLLHVTPTPNMNSTVTPPVQCCTDTIKLYICFFFSFFKFWATGFSCGTKQGTKWDPNHFMSLKLQLALIYLYWQSLTFSFFFFLIKNCGHCAAFCEQRYDWFEQFSVSLHSSQITSWIL